MWTKRDLAKIDQRLEWLKRLFYVPVQPMELYIAETSENLSLEAAEQLSYTPFAGGPWGEEWGSAWFKGQYTIDSGISQTVNSEERLFLQVDTGGESLVYIDGEAVGAIDRQHHEIPLRGLELDPGTHEVLIESYAGHHIDNRTKLTEHAQHSWEAPVFKHCQLVRRNEAAWNLYFDMATLYNAANQLPEDSLRKTRIYQTLLEAVHSMAWDTADIEGRNRDFRRISERLAPLLEKKNSPTTPIVNWIGHAHIDVAWLWPIKETIRKCGRTFATQLRYFDEYSFYQFIQSQAQCYEFVEKHYPRIFSRIVDAVQDRRWEVNGGMWVEADTNLPSTESLIRQFLIGQSYFQSKFGVKTDVLWLPDVFGYNGNLPQIMRGCGIKYFVTSKIGWNDTNQFPYDLFRWYGIDGSDILVLFIKNTYNSDTKPEMLHKTWQEFISKQETDLILDTVGYGDGGGGVTMEQLEYAKRLADLEGVPKTRFGFVSDLMEELEQNIEQYPKYHGEIYLELHRATYTTQAWTKRNNRKTEILFRDAELYAALAYLSTGSYPFERFSRLWKEFLTMQFHDVLPGSSITKVYEDCRESFTAIAAELNEIIDSSWKIIASSASCNNHLSGFLAANSLNWDREDRISIPLANADQLEMQIGDYCPKIPRLEPNQKYTVLDSDSRPLPTQVLEDRLVFLPGEVPAMSWAGFRVVPEDKAAIVNKPVTATAQGGQYRLENQYLTAVFNRHGQITSLYDKREKREAFRKPGNILLLSEDLPTNWDAWNTDHASHTYLEVVAGGEEISIAADGPIEARIRVVRPLGEKSRLVQDIVLGCESQRIDFVTRVDWHENHRTLRVAFPVDILAAQAKYEIQGGYIIRPTHVNTSWEQAKFEVPGHKWADLSEAGYGVALLNDSKYGYSIRESEIRLTLLKSAKAPDLTADIGSQVFTYSLYPHAGDDISGVVRQAQELNNPVRIVAIDQLPESNRQPWIQFESGQVELQAVKVAEDGQGIVLRLSEVVGKTQTVSISFRRPLQSVWETNMLEEIQSKVECAKGTQNGFDLQFKPFEIKTVKIALM